MKFQKIFSTAITAAIVAAFLGACGPDETTTAPDPVEEPTGLPVDHSHHDPATMPDPSQPNPTDTTPDPNDPTQPSEPAMPLVTSCDDPAVAWMNGSDGTGIDIRCPTASSRSYHLRLYQESEACHAVAVKSRTDPAIMDGPLVSQEVEPADLPPDSQAIFATTTRITIFRHYGDQAWSSWCEPIAQ